MIDSLVAACMVMLLFVTVGLTLIWLWWTYWRARGDRYLADVQHEGEQAQIATNYIRTIPVLIGGIAVFAAGILVFTIFFQPEPAPPEKSARMVDPSLLTSEIFGAEDLSGHEGDGESGDAEALRQRYEQAMEGLGNSNAIVVLSSIFVLERIAIGDQEYHWLVVEKLTDYVRKISPNDNGGKSRGVRDIVQAIVTVIGRRNLAHAELGKIKLRDADLSGIIMRRADLGGVDFNRTDFRDADLGAALLIEADLSKTNLKDTRFVDADLSAADLRGAKNLVQEQLDQGCGDQYTKLPEGLTISFCQPD